MDLQNKKIPNPTIAAPRSRSVLGSGTAMLSSAIAEDSGSVRLIVAIERIFFIAFRHQQVFVKYFDIRFKDIKTILN